MRLLSSSPLSHLIESHQTSLRDGWRLLILLWLMVGLLVSVASCTVYRSPTGEFVGAIGGKGSAGRKDDPILTWNNDTSFKDAARVAGTVTLAPVMKQGISTVGDLVKGKTANEAAQIASDQAIQQSTIDANAATEVLKANP